MDTFTSAAHGSPTPPFATRPTRRFAKTASAAAGLIAIAAAAYATMRPATANAQLTDAPSAFAPTVSGVAAADTTSTVNGNVIGDNSGVLTHTFGPATKPATVDAWTTLFPTTAPATVAESTTPGSGIVAPVATPVVIPVAVAPSVDAAARTAADPQPVTTAKKDDVVWTPAPTPNPTPTPTPAPAVHAPTGIALVSSGLNADGRIALTLNRTAEIKTNAPVKRISVGQPEVADVQPISPNLLLVTAKKPGVTQVIIWDDQDHSQSVDVNVEIPLEQLRDMIGRLAPGSNIEVAVANDTIILRGHAPNLTIAKQIGDVAQAYGKVQNFIEVAGTQTVAVQVQFAEVSRSVTNDLGVAWATSDGTAIFGSDPTSSGLLGYHTSGTDSVIDGFSTNKTPGSFNIFGLGRAAGNPFSYFIKALRDNSLLRVLQEPTLTTTSGEAASFLAGGQVAVPVPADNGSIGIEYKEYGVRLKLTPVVLGNGKIRLVMEAESSDLDYSAGTTISGAAVPGLRTRRVTNTVEMGEGQTMSVAGLLDNSVVSTKQSVPGLGDIPVLGQLFRSTRYQRKETELVILITPHLSGAMNPDQVPPLPGANWRHPSELEQFAFGDQGGNAEADAVRDWNKPNNQRGLRGNETQQTNPTAEPAGQTRNAQPAVPPTAPPRFFGEYGFTRAKDDAGTGAVSASARD